MTTPNTSASTTSVTSVTGIDPADIITTQTDPDINLVCPQCDRACPATDFYPDRTRANGRHRLCADCESDNARHTYAVSPEYRQRIKSNSRRNQLRYQLTTAVDTGTEKDWNDTETDYLINHYSIKITADIARDLGRSYHSVAAKVHRLGLRKNISRPAHPRTWHITGVGAAIHHDNRPWDRADDIYLYRFYNTRSLADWSILLERSEDMVATRHRHLRRPGNAPV